MPLAMPPDPPTTKIVLHTGEVIDPEESADLTLSNLKKVAAEAIEAARENRRAIEELKKAPDSGQFKSAAALRKKKGGKK